MTKNYKFAGKSYTWENKLKRDYGWTRRLIKKFYPKPDFHRAPPAPDLKEYNMMMESKILDIMESDEFKKEWERSLRFAARHINRDRKTYPGCKGYKGRKKTEENSEKDDSNVL